MVSNVDFWKVIREAGAEIEHELNIAGKTRVKCTTCNGLGYSSPGRSDYDAHGSFWVPQTDCLACYGSRYLEMPCSPVIEAAAIKREIAKLQKRLKSLKWGKK